MELPFWNDEKQGFEFPEGPPHRSVPLHLIPMSQGEDGIVFSLNPSPRLSRVLDWLGRRSEGWMGWEIGHAFVPYDVYCMGWRAVFFVIGWKELDRAIFNRLFPE